MLQVANFTEVNKLLANYFPAPFSLRKAYNLDQMQRLMQCLDNPQNQLKIIHVAGTSGKTSTSYYAAALLQAAGCKVGLTVSPHVEQINERVQINQRPLDQTKFCRYFTEFINISGVQDIKPTYFELMIAFAYWVFAIKEQVDYAVIEVGLGGLGDSTNVVERDDKVCIITDIGLDHMQILGDTITQIAAQKAGIIRPHNQVFTVLQDSAVLDVFKQAAARQEAQLTVTKPKDLAATLGLPPFAARDWQLAKAAIDYVIKRDSLLDLTAEQLLSTSHITVPARMEVFTYKNKTIILDGSHNQQKMAALVAGLEKRYPDKSVAVMLGFINSRADRVDQTVAQIMPLAEQTIITAPDMVVAKQDVRHQSLDTDVIKTACLKTGAQKVRVIKQPTKALEALLNCPQQVLLVTGSFYLMSQIRPLVRSAANHD